MQASSQPHPDFDAIAWDTWSPVDHATLCFVIHNQRILLIHKKRGLGKGKINGPGGRLEPGESPEQCAIRETREELGITPLHLTNRGLLRFQFADGYSIQAHLFTATNFRGTPVETDEAIPRWTPLDAIPYPRMWADDILWIPRMLEGRTTHGRFLFHNDTMLGYHLQFL